MAKFVRVDENGIVREVINGQLPPFDPVVTAMFHEVPDDSPLEEYWNIDTMALEDPNNITG